MKKGDVRKEMKYERKQKFGSENNLIVQFVVFFFFFCLFVSPSFIHILLHL